MECISFDNEKLNNFFIKKIGKDKFSLGDILKIFTIDEIKKEENLKSFKYKLALEEFKVGIRKEEPKKEDYIYSTFSSMGKENLMNFNVILDELYFFTLSNEEISINDFSLIIKIREQVGKDEDNLYKILFPDSINYLKIKGTNIKVRRGISNETEIEINNFSKVNKSDLLKFSKNVDNIKVNITNFYGLTLDKLEAIGEQQYYIEGDLGNPYNITEMRRILILMENIRVQTENSEEIDKFLSAYKSLAMYVDYDESGNKTSEEYINGNENETRSLRGAFFYGKAVCAGYSLALKCVSNYIGLEADEVSGIIYDDNGEELGKHAWNIIKIDGIWYNTDLTWDYEDLRKGKKLNYCLKEDKSFYKNRGNITMNIWHTCNKDYNPEEIAIRLANLPYTELDKVLFDAGSEQGFEQSEIESIAILTISVNPNFSNNTVKALKGINSYQINEIDKD